MSIRSIRYNTIEQHFTKSANASTDRDALAFLEAAQIYNTNQQRAIVNLVRSLKRTGLWSKMKAIYPFIGGTATSHKWNLKNSQDTDAAFRLTFSGGWTHSSTGALPNGSNAYANTYFNSFINAVSNNRSFSVYVRSDTAGSFSKIEMAAYDQGVSPNRRWEHYSKATDGLCYVSIGLDFKSYTNADSRGYYINSKNSGNSLNAWKNDVKKINNQSVLEALENLNTYIGARNLTGSANAFSDREIAFATIGDGLTDTDATNLYNIVDLYQKRLGRAV